MSIKLVPREIIEQEFHLSLIYNVILRKELNRIPYPRVFSKELQLSIIEEGLPLLFRFWEKMDLTNIRSYALERGNGEVLEALRLLDYPFDSMKDMIEAAEYGNYEAICYLRNRGIPCNKKVMAAAAASFSSSAVKKGWNSMGSILLAISYKKSTSFGYLLFG